MGNSSSGGLARRRLLAAGRAAVVVGGASLIAANCSGGEKQSPAKVDDASGGSPKPVSPVASAPPNTIVVENRVAGTTDWIHGRLGSASDDVERQCQGYASATTVAPGGSLDLFVTMNPAQEYWVTVYRLGHYGGSGAREVLRSPRMAGKPQAAPRVDAGTGALYCAWDKSWKLDIPKDWVSGAYLAVLTNERGKQGYVPFVVTDHRAADFLCVLPFATYQAYNLYPMDGVGGQSVYYAYDRQGKLDPRLKKTQVSFSRPFANGGTTQLLKSEHNFIRFAERNGYDITYASSFDLHEGRVDPSRYKVIVVPGHDEYWSQQMRDVLDDAKRRGTHIASFAANQCYWRVRIAPSADGDTRLTVHKDTPDPGAARGPAKLWRDVGHPEQLLWGSCYGQQGFGVAKPLPFLVKNAAHWFWKATGVTEGQALADLVQGETDHQVAGVPLPKSQEMVVLSHSNFKNTGGLDDRQEAVLYRDEESGGWVFNAGTFGWGLFLSGDAPAAKVVQTATENLFARMLAT